MSIYDRPVRCAINGYGRIGRSILRALFEYRRWPIEIVAINDLAQPEAIAHLTRFDSTHGRFQIPVELKGNQLHVAAFPIQLLRQEELSQLIWAELAVDVVFECTGRIKSRAGAQIHLDSGAGKVLISNPADSRVDAHGMGGRGGPGQGRGFTRTDKQRRCGKRDLRRGNRLNDTQD